MVVISKQYAGLLQPIYILRVIYTLYTNHTASIVPKSQICWDLNTGTFLSPGPLCVVLLYIKALKGYAVLAKTVTESHQVYT